VPLDGSRRAECALPAATAIAQASGAQLTLLSVIRPPELPASEPYVGELKEMCERMGAAISRAFRAYLQEVAERQPVHVETRLVEHASVTRAIQEMATGQGADLVVLCAHGQASQGDYPYGAVARHYIHEGTTSLLIVQDIPRSQTVPTEAERAAESTRSR
jgi:nucleotide-binding universal stress UspA family protein